jgi:hypothetical protein
MPSEDATDDTDRDELLLSVSEKLETAATDLQHGDVEAAGSELRNAAWEIQRSLNTGGGRAGGGFDAE